jgi:hypothetical protein
MSAMKLFELVSPKSGRRSLMLTGVVRAISSLAREGCRNGLSPEHVQTARVSKFMAAISSPFKTEELR